MADVYTPCQYAHQGSTHPLDKARCKAQVYTNQGGCGRFDQCTRKPHADGWCKQHHPDVEAARRAAADAKYEADRRRQAMGRHGERMMAALIKIRDGDNDPRTTAAEALAGIKYAQELSND